MTEFLLSPVPWWAAIGVVAGWFLRREDKRDRARKKARAERLAWYAYREHQAEIERDELEEQFRLPSAVGFPKWKSR